MITSLHQFLIVILQLLVQNQSPHSTAEGEGSSEEDNELDGRVEKILAPAKGSIDVENRRFVVKLHERSYRAVQTVSESVLMEHCPQLMRNYLVKVIVRPGLRAELLNKAPCCQLMQSRDHQ